MRILLLFVWPLQQSDDALVKQKGGGWPVAAPLCVGVCEVDCTVYEIAVSPVGKGRKITLQVYSIFQVWLTEYAIVVITYTSKLASVPIDDAYRL